ncbi:MAG: hypothetical protein O2819_00335 [Planctomycetota bacterium]|nr:hypothetical protein [Planctomycetota bacterium]MDA1105394.1 hypothetical protein [Planctomycetota bacterium]
MTSGELTRIGFEHDLPGWGWLLVVLGIAALTMSVYLRQRAPTHWRMVMAAIRASVALLLVLLLLGPREEVIQQERLRDEVVLLVDRSASLTVSDVDGPGVDGARITRDAQLRQLLQERPDSQSEPWWEALGARSEVITLRFDASVTPLSLGADLPPPIGQRTDIGQALSEAMRRTAGRPVAGIVLITDGRGDGAVPRRVLRDLAQRGIAVFPIPLGSATMSRDLEVADVAAPRRAYVRDTVPVHVDLRVRGEAPTDPVIIRLIDDADGHVVDEATVKPDAWNDGRAEAMVVAQSTEPGDRSFHVELVAPGDAASGGDLVVENNVRRLEMAFADEPLRVLYLEGYPRWDYRYLKNLLIREGTIDSSVMLVSADLDFAQEGNVPLARMPQTDEEFVPFDLFIIGDVPGAFLAPSQLEAMRRAVGERGTGLLWLGGERSTPSSWRGTALEDLLPFRNADIRGAAGSWSALPTRVAERLGVLRLGESGEWPIALQPPAQRWARMTWRQDIQAANLKGAVEVLAQAVPLDGEEPQPLVTLMRFGAGEVIYVGTDETWRWRHGIGETLQERFWVQLIRQLARTSLAVRGEAATIEAEPTPARLDRPCTIRVQLRDAQRDPEELESLSIKVVSPSGQSQPVTLVRQGSTGLFSGSFVPDLAGSWSLVLDDARIGAASDTQLLVERVDDELANPAADHEQLAQLAKVTGGTVIAVADIGDIQDLLPDRSVTIERVTATPLWHAWWVLALLTALLTAEWMARKAVRLA